MLRFTKMHGAGNDFICLDGVTEPAIAARGDLGPLAAAMTARNTGVGADGLIVIAAAGEPARRAVSMRMFNVDGSESAMCGNGLRCVAKYALDHGLVDAPDGRVLVDTASGRLEAACRRGPSGVVAVTVDMGRPVLELADIPVDRRRLAGGGGPAWRLGAGGEPLEAVFVSMGNPHAVIYVERGAGEDAARLGPVLERHPAFPKRMNVHFVEVASPREVTVRTWERGCGLTAACGSGACAVCVAGVLTGRGGREILAHLPGGDLEIRWDAKTDHVLMTGPAVEVFTGEWEGDP